MAYNNTLTQAVTHGLSEQIAGFVATYRAKAARRKLYRETLNELRALTDRDLADLGLHRSMLHRIAYQAAHES